MQLQRVTDTLQITEILVEEGHLQMAGQGDDLEGLEDQEADRWLHLQLADEVNSRDVAVNTNVIASSQLR